MTEVYRFRSTDRLLMPEHRELEQQTIYFADIEELNDPMEGLRDIVWVGDEIVWLNLFKHYVYCLNASYLRIMIAGDHDTFKADQIPISGRWDEPPTPQLDDLYRKIWTEICDDRRLPDLAKKVSARGKVRFPELMFYLNGIHAYALGVIQAIYIELGFSADPESAEHNMMPENPVLATSAFINLLPQVEAQYKNVSEVMFSICHQMTACGHLRLKYNLRNAELDVAERNSQLLLVDFTTLYVQQLESLLWPRWYTACFSKTYCNSSLWANYANGHTGACLIFEPTETEGARTLSLKQVTGSSSDSNGNFRDHWDFSSMPFRDVSYSQKPTEVDFFANIGMLPLPAIMKLWFTDEAGNVSTRASQFSTDNDLESWHAKHWGDYGHDIALKSKDWEYEAESRLILHGLIDDSLAPHRRTLTYDFESLKGIIFGIRISDEHKVKIIDIIHRKCLEYNRTDFKFFQAYYCPEHGDIRKYEIRLRFAGDSGCVESEAE